VAALKDALARCRWSSGPIDWTYGRPDGMPRQPDCRLVAIRGAAWVDINAADGCLRAALENPSLREFAESQPGVVWRSVVNLLHKPGRLAGKRAVVSDLLDSGLPADAVLPTDGDVEDPNPRCFWDPHAAAACCVASDGESPEEAPELMRFFLRAGLFGDDPDFIEDTCEVLRYQIRYNGADDDGIYDVLQDAWVRMGGRA